MHRDLHREGVWQRHKWEKLVFQLQTAHPCSPRKNQSNYGCRHWCWLPCRFQSTDHPPLSFHGEGEVRKILYVLSVRSFAGFIGLLIRKKVVKRLGLSAKNLPSCCSGEEQNNFHVIKKPPNSAETSTARYSVCGGSTSALAAITRPCFNNLIKSIDSKLTVGTIRHSELRSLSSDHS